MNSYVRIAVAESLRPNFRSTGWSFHQDRRGIKTMTASDQPESGITIKSAYTTVSDETSLVDLIHDSPVMRDYMRALQTLTAARLLIGMAAYLVLSLAHVIHPTFANSSTLIWSLVFLLYSYCVAGEYLLARRKALSAYNTNRSW